MSVYYTDCEFDGHNGPLLTMAVVRDDGVSVYIRTPERASHPWVIAYVERHIEAAGSPIPTMTFTDKVGGLLRAWIEDDEHPVIVADSPVDIARFCQAISTGEGGGWISTDFPRMTFEVHNVDCYPTDLPGAVQHNAWWDAMALRHTLAARQSGGAQ